MGHDLQVFKSYSIQTHAEALGFTQDLKLGHYLKIPPRSTFAGMFTSVDFPAIFY